MTDDRFAELVPLAALGALDGDDRAGFEAHLTSCSACRGALEADEILAARIPLALAPVPPSAALRPRLLDATRSSLRPAAARGALPALLALAAALVLGVGVVVMRSERDAARRELDSARQEADALRRSAQGVDDEARKTREEAAVLRKSLEQEHALAELVAHPETRVAHLAGLKDAPKAQAQVVWNPARREAVLIAHGLPPLAVGKAYEVWVIAQAAPVAAGVFQVDAQGHAVFRLPVVAETARAKTFAVTLETAAGTTAPSGPMVLAGAAS